MDLEFEAAIALDYQNGCSIPSIASNYHLTKERTKRVLGRHGVRVRDLTETRNMFPHRRALLPGGYMIMTVPIPERRQHTCIGKGQMKVHRYVMENHLGRRLRRWEDVDHIDGNRQNNNISNLRIMIRTPKEWSNGDLRNQTGISVEAACRRAVEILKDHAPGKLK